MLNFGKVLMCGSLLALVACPAEDDGNDDGADSGSSSASTTMSTTNGTEVTDSMTMSSTSSDPDTSTGDVDPSECPGAGGAAAVGDACTANADCASGICVIFTDVPLNDDAVCGDNATVSSAGCTTRITGTVFDFSSLAAVDGATMKVAGALNAITNPGGAMSLADATSGADGRVDVTTDVPVNQAIAIIALVEGPGGYLTATGLAAPVEGSTYEVGNGIHDLWLVPQDKVTAWSTALGSDPEVTAAQLPIGDAGGVVGFVRDATGAPIVGAVIEPMEATSASVIRYVAADDTIVSDMTTETGIFIVIGAAQTGEVFNATMGGSTIASGTAGSANGAVFTLILNGA
jgi:hypothetical protein